MAGVSALAFLLGGLTSSLVLFGLEPPGIDIPFEICMPAAIAGSLIYLATRQKEASNFLKQAAIWVLIVVGFLTGVSLLMLSGH